MKQLSLRGVAVAAAAVMAFTVAAPNAQAVTWVKIANTTHKAYAVNNFVVRVGPSVAPAVSGYTAYSKTITVKNSAGTNVAVNVTSKLLGKGTYRVYSTFKYRKKVATTTTVTGSGRTSLEYLVNARCVLTNVEVHPANEMGDEESWTPTATCTGTFNGYSVTITGLRGDEAFMGGSIPTSEHPVGVVGTVFGPTDWLWDWYVSENSEINPVVWTGTKKVTTYKWVYAPNRYRWRYATVVKVYPARATWTNCTSVNATFKHGVGKTTAVDRTTGVRVTTFLKNNELYALAMRYNAGLDRDKDGIACEKG